MGERPPRHVEVIRVLVKFDERPGIRQVADDLDGELRHFVDGQNMNVIELASLLQKEMNPGFEHQPVSGHTACVHEQFDSHRPIAAWQTPLVVFKLLVQQLEEQLAEIGILVARQRNQYDVEGRPLISDDRASGAYDDFPVGVYACLESRW